MEDYSYATRESAMSASDIRASAWASLDIDAALASGARAVDNLCHRGAYDRGIPGFLPWTGSLSFDWPNDQDARSGRLWLEQHSLTSLTSATSAGQTIPTSAVFLEPSSSGPPYSRIELDRSTSYSFNAGSGIGQRSLVLGGVWSAVQVTETSPSGFTLSGSPNSSTTTWTVNGPAYVGDILRVDSERVLVQDKTWTASGQTATLAAQPSGQTLTVADASGFRPGEELLIDAERVLVRDVAGNNVVVQRAWSGSTLAAHTGAAIYWPRSLTVRRGALGTTAASHTSGTQISRNVIPSMIAELNLAYALDTFYQRAAGYARTVGEGENQRPASGRGIRELEERVYWTYGRRRSGAV